MQYVIDQSWKLSRPAQMLIMEIVIVSENSFLQNCELNKVYRVNFYFKNFNIGCWDFRRRLTGSQMNQSGHEHHPSLAALRLNWSLPEAFQGQVQLLLPRSSWTCCGRHRSSNNRGSRQARRGGEERGEGARLPQSQAENRDQGLHRWRQDLWIKWFDNSRCNLKGTGNFEFHFWNQGSRFSRWLGSEWILAAQESLDGMRKLWRWATPRANYFLCWTLSCHWWTGRSCIDCSSLVVPSQFLSICQ